MQRKRLVLHHNIIEDELAYFYSEGVAKIRRSSLKK